MSGPNTERSGVASVVSASFSALLSGDAAFTSVSGPAAA
jgi:hypothetical protein